MEIQIDKNSIFEFLKSRRSYQSFIYKKVKDDIIKEILDSAYQGLVEKPTDLIKINVVVHPTVKQMISELMDENQSNIVTESYVDLIIFLNLERSKNKIEEYQIIGAFIQNILLGAHAVKDLGATWVKNITEHNDKILEIFKLSKRKYELTGIISMGAIDETTKKINSLKQKKVEEFADWF